MATALDTKLIPKIVSTVAKFGTLATFRTYPSQTVDPIESKVTQGTAVDYSVKVTPPEPYREELSPDGRATHEEMARVFLPSGLGTSDAIAFTPARNQTVIIGSKTWTVTLVEPISTGDLVALYGIILKA